jgi:hypothetical protein
MRRTFLCLVGILSISSLASAATPECVSGTLASYIALGSEGCSIGVVTFANFGYAAKARGDAQQIPPDQVKVDPLNVIFSPRLSFSAKWTAGSGQTQDSFIKYTVQPDSAHTNTGILQLQFGTAQVGLFGTIAVWESTDIGELHVLTECTEVCRSKKTDTLQFWPMGTLQVTDHVSVVSRNGEASLSSFTATFNLCFLCP